MNQGRRRDRRGRGLRGPLGPAELPVVRTRAERFDDLVLDAVERLEKQWAPELADVEFAVEDVPPAEPGPGADPVPLGAVLAATALEPRPPRVVLYRWPIVARVRDGGPLGALVHDVVVEQVADLLGLEPETVDPRYRGPDDSD